MADSLFHLETLQKAFDKVSEENPNRRQNGTKKNNNKRIRLSPQTIRLFHVRSHTDSNLEKSLLKTEWSLILMRADVGSFMAAIQFTSRQESVLFL